MALNKFEAKKYEAAVLGEIYAWVKGQEESAHKSYQVVGKQEEQAKSWSTGELLWEDEAKTIPMYRDKYEYVQVADEDLSDEDLAKIAAYQRVMSMLEKML